jgi:outer membrane protein assembly factor BamD
MHLVKARNFYLLFLPVLLFFSCSKFERLLKSSDYELKYTKAIEYFERKNYTNAFALFEELIPVFKGTEKGEKVYYYYAMCNYLMGDYGLAAYHLKTFSRTFPTSDKAEQCAFLNAYCYYLSSPKSSLDQQDTKMAIDEMQEFVNNYPSSQKIDSCNLIIDDLRKKLEKKSYDITKQYYFLEDWKASVAESNNFIKDFPESTHNEELYFIIIKSYFLLGKNSIEAKKLERLEKSRENYLKFIDLYPQSKYLREAESIYEESIKLINEINQ